MKILLVEDDGVSRRIMQRSIDRLGHRCVSVGDGDEAWEAYERSPDFDVIISGWEMPGLSGLELCERVRNEASRRDAYPFFVFWTPLAGGDYVLVGARAGADYHLAKPLEGERLEACLTTAARISSHKRPASRRQAPTDRDGDRAPSGLGSRTRLLEDLAIMGSRAERYEHGFCVVLCGVDSPKPHHDLLDDVVRQVAGVVLKSFRRGDSAYHYGAGTFLIVLPEQSTATAAIAVDRLRKKVEGLPPVGGPAGGSPGAVTLSIGLAESGSGGPEAAASVLERARTAFEEAKRRGGNRVEIYERGA